MLQPLLLMGARVIEQRRNSMVNQQNFLGCEDWQYQISGQALAAWRSQAQKAAVVAEIPISEVDWFLQAIARVDPLTLRLGTLGDRAAVSTKFSLEELSQLWQRRVQERVPVQYLVGLAPWRHFWLEVSPAVLIPRPETELIIDLVVQAVQGTAAAQGDWADLGTGSGAIALGLAEALPQAHIHAVDTSPAAIAIAQRNAERYFMGDRLQFYQGSWLEPLGAGRGQLAGLVSNPPYIPSAIVPTLQHEVVQHEPSLALDGGPDGLDCIRHLARTAPAYLQSGGLWVVEMMAGQGEAIASLLADLGAYRDIRIELDLAGHDRFAIARRV